MATCVDNADGPSLHESIMAKICTNQESQSNQYIHLTLLEMTYPKTTSCESRLQFTEKLGGNLITTVALDTPQHALSVIMLQERLARVIELF